MCAARTVPPQVEWSGEAAGCDAVLASLLRRQQGCIEIAA